MEFLSLNGVEYLWTTIKNYINTIFTNIQNREGQPDGIATLDSQGKINNSQLPNFKTVNGQSIQGIGNIDIDLSIHKIVPTLPVPELANPEKIYLVRNEDSEDSKNIYDEYMCINGEWELIGQYKTDVDLSGYVKNDDLATILTDGLMSSSDKNKLDNIQSNATYDSPISDAELDEILI